MKDCFQFLYDQSDHRFALFPRARSASSDIYLYYSSKKLLIGIACKNFGKTPFSKEHFKDELKKVIFPKAKNEWKDIVENVVLLICNTNGEYCQNIKIQPRDKKEEEKDDEEEKFVQFKIIDESNDINICCLFLKKEGLKCFLGEQFYKLLLSFKENEGKRVNLLKNFGLLWTRKKDMEEEKKKLLSNDPIHANVFTYINSSEMKRSEVTMNEGIEDIKRNLFEQCGGQSSEKEKRWNDYYFFTVDDLKNEVTTPSIVNYLKRTSKSVYFITLEEKKRKMEEEEKKRKMEEEEKKRKMEEEEKKRKMEEEEKKRKMEEEEQLLRAEEEAKIFFVDKSNSATYLLVSMKTLKDCDHDVVVSSFLELKILKKFMKKEEKECTLFQLYVEDGEIVGDSMELIHHQTNEKQPFGEFLIGKTCFLLTDEQRNVINEQFEQGKLKKKNGINLKKLKEHFRAGSGMSLFDLLPRNKKDDDDDKDGHFLSFEESCSSSSDDFDFDFEEAKKNRGSEKRKKENIVICCGDWKLETCRDLLEKKSNFFQQLLGMNNRHERMMDEEGEEGENEKEGELLRINEDEIPFLVVKCVVEMIYFDHFLFRDMFGELDFVLLLRLLHLCGFFGESEFERVVWMKLDWFMSRMSEGEMELEIAKHGSDISLHFPSFMRKKLIQRICSFYNLPLSHFSEYVQLQLCDEFSASENEANEKEEYEMMTNIKVPRKMKREEYEKIENVKEEESTPGYRVKRRKKSDWLELLLGIKKSF